MVNMPQAHIHINDLSFGCPGSARVADENELGFGTDPVSIAIDMLSMPAAMVWWA